MLDENNDIYILEINTLPGLTDTSLFPKAYHEEFKDICNKSNKTYDLLVLEIIKLALK
jgi:D-alanine-D-alanine ligase-like ATP-grasp enzyme